MAGEDQPASPILRSHELEDVGISPPKDFQHMFGSDAFIPESALHRVGKAGVGSFSVVEVCKYHNGETEQLVAVKRLKAKTSICIAELAVEARILRSLHHRNIVRFIGVGGSIPNDEHAQEDKNTYYIVEEYIGGGGIGEKLELQMKRPWSQQYSFLEAMTWARELAQGLAYMHNHQPQVIHRDMKLDNCLLRRLGQNTLEAAICDFGLAVTVTRHPAEDPATPKRMRSLKRLPSRVSHEIKSEGAIASKDLQQKDSKLQDVLAKWTVNPAPSSTSSVGSCMPGSRLEARQLAPEIFQLTGRIGTFTYMAPEITLCQPYNEKVDVFSFGVVLYELFSRQLVSSIVMEATLWSADYECFEIYAFKVAHGFRPPLPKHWPEDLRVLIRECMDADPAQRPDMTAVIPRLKALELECADWQWKQHKCGGCACF